MGTFWGATYEPDNEAIWGVERIISILAWDLWSELFYVAHWFAVSIKFNIHAKLEHLIQLPTFLLCDFQLYFSYQYVGHLLHSRMYLYLKQLNLSFIIICHISYEFATKAKMTDFKNCEILIAVKRVQSFIFQRYFVLFVSDKALLL